MKVSQSQPQSSSSRQLQSVCSQLSDSLQQQKEKIFELEAKLRQKSRSQYQQDSSTQICLQVKGLVRDLAFGWLVGSWLNSPLRWYFSLYWAVFQREGEREEKRQRRVKMSKQPPPAPTASTIGPCHIIIQFVGRPCTGSLPRAIAPPHHPLRDLAGDRAGEELEGHLIISIRPGFYFSSENTSHQ